MSELHDYITGEIVEDHNDGILSRREAMRRLALLGLGASAATALLATPASAALSARAKKAKLPQEVVWDTVATTPITFPGPRGTLMGAWAPAADPLGAVLVMHENRGLTDHIRTVTSRLAGSGYSALALDLLSQEGGTGAFP